MPPRHPPGSLSPRQISQIHAHFIKTPQSHILNPLLGALTSSAAPLDALFLYNIMLRHPAAHNHYTFTYALKACSILQARHKGTEIHAGVLKSGHCSDVFIQNSLLHFYFLSNDVVSANRIFGSINFPDVVSWTSLISGLSRCGFEREALDKFAAMDVEPNCATLVSILSACCGLWELNSGRAIHGYVLKNWRRVGVILWNAVLNLYVKCGFIWGARNLFTKMPERDVFSWTTMIGGYALSGFHKDSIELFQEMLQVGPEPNEATVVTALSACSSSGVTTSSEWVHTYLSSQRNIPINGPVGNALINMFVKCGNVGKAIGVFIDLQAKDVVSWSTIISGLAMAGRGNHALQLFSLMLVHGIPPDGVTFIGLLSACSHSGLINQGLMLYEAMDRVYGIQPQMQHYACVVDMYGRAGLLEEAEAFIRAMPVEADGSVWGALLNACKVHGDEVMFGLIRTGLVRSRSVSIGTLALLSNAYAGCEKWNDANRIRNDMRLAGLKKMAGSSRVEIRPMINI